MARQVPCRIASIYIGGRVISEGSDAGDVVHDARLDFPREGWDFRRVTATTISVSAPSFAAMEEFLRDYLHVDPNGPMKNAVPE